jgi:RNA polymerase sigma factor (sigma-70 family)
MRHLPIMANAPVEAVRRGMSAPSPDGLDEGFLTEIQTYLELRSRGIDPPPPLVEAWNRFYAFHAPRIQSYLKGWKLPEADRSDCFQEVWKDIVGKLAHFQRDPRRGRLSTWLMTLAHNKVVDSIRRRCRHPFESLEDYAASTPWDPRPDPADEYERHRTLDRVRRALAELSGQVSRTSFQVLYLRWMEGLPTAEVATALEITPAQVRFRSHRMKRKFRALLEQSMEEDLSDLPQGVARKSEGSTACATGFPHQASNQ